jgi:protein-S-isoprenylcysteine O-methyltransferase Ste14
MTTRRPGVGALVCAWTGAAAFVASLLVFLYLYGITYGRVRAASPAGRAVVTDILLFSLFALHHSLLARSGLKRRVTQVLPDWLERSAFTWAASALFVFVCVAWQPVDGVLYSLPGTWRVVGYIAQGAGILLVLAGAAAIDVLDLAGVRQILDARSGQPTRHAALKTDGIHGLVRHPVYFGWTLLVFAAPHMTGTRALFATVSTLYLAIAIPFEERSLVEVFGETYRRYQRATRWKMLPGIW